MPISPAQLAEGVSKLISLPDICFRVNEMVDDPRYSAVDIGNVVANDPAITAQLLRIANSAYYGFPSRVDTLSRAIAIIGTQELRDLVLTTSIINSFHKVKPEVIDFQEFWRHSLATALAARAMVKRMRARILHGERLFIAGLLHDMGHLVMAVRIPELLRVMRTRAEDAEEPMDEAERLVFDLDHAEVGAALMQHWRLPASLQMIAKYHHHPEKAGEQAREAAIINIANNIAYQAGMKGIDSELDARVAPGAWELAGLTQESVAPIILEIGVLYDAAATVFLPAKRVASR